MTKHIIRTKLTILLSVIFTTMFLLSAIQVNAMSDVELYGGYFPGSWRMTGEYKCITPDEVNSETEDYLLSIELVDDDYAENSPGATFGKIALIFLVPLAVIVLLIVLIVRAVKKKNKG